MTSQSFIDTLHIDCGFFDQCVVNLIIPAINVVLVSLTIWNYAMLHSYLLGISFFAHKRQTL